MKKHSIILIVFAIFLVFSCSSKSDSKNDSDATSDADSDLIETVDDDSDYQDSDFIDDSDEIQDENIDIDTDSDKALETDDGDSDTTLETDDDDSDTTAEYVDNDIELPECSASSDVPCYDSSSGLIWSEISSSEMTWYNAVDYCLNYSESGLSGWHIPTISELRTLIKNCNGTVMGGSCGVIDSCLTIFCDDDCYSCNSYEDGRYSKFGDTVILWSSSYAVVPGEIEDGAVWYVDFSSGGIYSTILFFDSSIFFRCVTR